jgi:hypothetical protein
MWGIISAIALKMKETEAVISGKRVQALADHATREQKSRMRDDSSRLHEWRDKLKTTLVFSMGNLKENLLLPDA